MDADVRVVNTYVRNHRLSWVELIIAAWRMTSESLSTETKLATTTSNEDVITTFGHDTSMRTTSKSTAAVTSTPKSETTSGPTMTSSEPLPSTSSAPESTTMTTTAPHPRKPVNWRHLYINLLTAYVVLLSQSLDLSLVCDLVLGLVVLFCLLLSPWRIKW